MLKSIEYRIEEGKDHGKVFIIRQMPPLKAEKWAQEFSEAFAKLTPNILSSAMTHPSYLLKVVLAVLFSEAHFIDLKSLFRTLRECCEIKQDGAPKSRPISKDDIEDPMTLVSLRTKAFALHKPFLTRSK